MKLDQASKKYLQGTVVSTSMDKTAVIAIVRKEKHKKYNKYIKKVTKCYAHDSNNSCKVGEVVKIESTRPLSKLKRWVVVDTNDLVGEAL